MKQIDKCKLFEVLFFIITAIMIILALVLVFSKPKIPQSNVIFKYNEQVERDEEEEMWEWAWDDWGPV